VNATQMAITTMIVIKYQIATSKINKL